jgi:hypothetical protein
MEESIKESGKMVKCMAKVLKRLLLDKRVTAFTDTVKECNGSIED